MKRRNYWLLVNFGLLAIIGFLKFPFTASAQIEDWRFNPGTAHSYALTPALSWIQARTYAQARGAELVTIRSEAENQWLVNAFGGDLPFWIGLSDLAVEGSWTWSSGEMVSFLNWRPGEPDDGNRRLKRNPDTGNYYMVTDSMSWTEAEAFCRSIGGHLVAIGNAAEQVWLARTFGVENLYWIGFSDRAQEGTWIWTSGEPVTFVNWAHGQPDDASNPGPEDYAVVNWDDRGGWADIGDWSPQGGKLPGIEAHMPPGHLLPGICELPPAAFRRLSEDFVVINHSGPGRWGDVRGNAFANGIPAIMEAPAETVAFDSFRPARLQVTIEPQEAVAAGAKWRVADGAWHATGDVADGLLPGTSGVVFLNLPLWAEPEPELVELTGGGMAELSLVYRPLPVHTVGDIPPQSVRHEKPLEFVVDGHGQVVSITVGSQPSGSVTFDTITGVFRYMPDERDRTAFEVVFQTPDGASQRVTIRPIPDLPAEQSLLKYVGELRDPANRDYLSITITPSAGQELFNHTTRTTRDVTIVGMHVVFEEGSAENDLYTLFRRAEDLREMRIYADTVIVRATLEWPSTHVVIHARVLQFEDLPGKDPGTARIVTKPGPYLGGPGESVEGARGLAGGDAEIYAERVLALPRPYDTARLVLRGGEGQTGGRGGKGENGVDLPVVIDFGYQAREIGGEHAVWIGDNESGCDSDVTWQGVKAWPGDGQPGKLGGKPGLGGTGGRLSSNLNLQLIADFSGGSSGTRAEPAPGGDPGNPNPASWWTCPPPDVRAMCGFCQAHYSRRGPDSPAPFPDHPKGENGIISLSESSSWLHPLLLDGVLAYVREAYLQGHLDVVTEITDRYLATITAQANSLPEDLLVDVEQAADELSRLRNQVNGNLDYFGYPAGWVPMLSFESNLIMFENELEDAIPSMYLAYWLRRQAEETGAGINSMLAARKAIEEELPRLRTRFTEIESLIPGLATEVRDMEQDIVFLQGLIETREQELTERAEENVEERNKLPLWKMGLRITGAILKVVPYYQPALAIVGTGLQFISEMDPNEPLDSLWEKRDMLSGFKADQFENQAKAFRQALDNVNLQDENYKQEAELLKATGKLLSQAGKEIGEILKERAAPRSEVEAELERLRAEDPEISDLVDQAAMLSRRLEDVGGRIASLTVALVEVTTSIQNNILTYDAIQSDLASSLQRLSPRAVGYVEAMEQRTMDRLLRYLYLVVKAYHYRLVEPYDGELNLNLLFEQFRNLADDGIDPGSEAFALKFTQLRQVYIDQLSRIADQIYTSLNSRAPERSGPVTFGLTDEELKQLNEQGRVVIDLARRQNLFGRTEENLRIADLRTSRLDVHAEGGPYGTMATLRIRYEHSGRSLLTSRGETYRFEQYPATPENRISWKTVYNGLSGQLDETAPSKASESLLEMLLTREGRDVSNLLLYSLPAALTQLTIDTQVSTDNAVQMIIDALQLTLSYDYFERRPDLRGLSVDVTDSLIPMIRLNVADINGRQDGQGAFRRTYFANQHVTLDAEPTYGQWEFERWTDEQGNDLNPPALVSHLEISLSEDVRIRAVYRQRE